MTTKTAVTPDIHSARKRCSIALTLAMVSLCLLPGCVSARGMFGRNRDHMAGAPRLKNMKNPPIEEVVAHLNQNTNRIESWRTDKVRIQAENFSFSGNIAVEKGRHLRLFVISPLGKEIDLGSNDERFWVWSRRMEPAFVTCKHENMEMARQEYGIPFEPDWLMQALGVDPLPTTGVKMEADPGNEQARLIEEVISAHGRPLRRVVLVDLKRGIVLEHSLYAYNGGRIALARLSDHRHDKKTGIVLPHRVMLEWPENKMSMVLTLGEIRVNPATIPGELWEMPAPADCQVVHLDAGAKPKNVMTAVRTGSGVRLGQIETANSHEGPNFLRDSGDSFDGDDSTGRAKLSSGSDENDQEDRSDDDWAK